MGVTEYRLTHALPEGLKSQLPTNEDLAAELPLLDLLTLRIQLERRLAQMAKEHDLDWERESARPCSLNSFFLISTAR
jgi:hypothetical protein